MAARESGKGTGGTGSMIFTTAVQMVASAGIRITNASTLPT